RTMQATSSESGVSDAVQNARTAITSASVPISPNNVIVVPLTFDPIPHVPIPSSRIAPVPQRWLPPTSGTPQPSCVAAYVITTSTVRSVAERSLRVSIIANHLLLDQRDR